LIDLPLIFTLAIWLIASLNSQDSAFNQELATSKYLTSVFTGFWKHQSLHVQAEFHDHAGIGKLNFAFGLNNWFSGFVRVDDSHPDRHFPSAIRERDI